MRHRRRIVLGVLALALLLTACARNAPQDTLDPKGPIARQIDNLITPVFAIAAVIFVLVQFLTIYTVIRYRARPNTPEPVQIHGNTRLELTWTVIPAVILLGVAVPTIRTIFDLNREPANAVHVTVIGHQFWWELRYDDYGFVTANELHIPVGRPVQLTLKGVDVIHSYWIPALAGKTDVIPNRTNRMQLQADAAGTYLGQCTEYCGLSHANMRAKAIAQPPAEFDQWVQAQKKPPAMASAGSPAATGSNLFVSKGCAGCHTIEGVSTGNVGPNLTHLQSRTTFAAVLFDMTAPNLAKWLKNPPAEKPGAQMPNLNLTPDEIDKLVAYLEILQ